MNVQEPPPLEIRCYFVRGRNALVTRGDFTPLFVDYYLGLADIGQRFSPHLDLLLKKSIVGLCLHAAGRPHKETLAWTLHFEDPMCNIFVTADNQNGRVIGTIFSDNVRKEGRNLLYCDVVTPGQPRRRSVVELHTPSAFSATTQLFEQSEQRPAKLFCYMEEDFILITGQPDCDEEWIAGLDEPAIRALDQTEELSLLETRTFRWECGCTLEKMLQVLSAPMRSDPEALFGEEPSLRMRCPRCGKPYQISRSELEAFVLPGN